MAKRQEENHELRPAVLDALGRIPEWRGCVVPIEKLTRDVHRTRPKYEIPAGTPDIQGTITWCRAAGLEVVMGAQAVALELKTAGGKHRKAQVEEIARLQARGVRVFTVRSPGEAIHFIELIKQDLRRAGLTPCPPRPVEVG